NICSVNKNQKNIVLNNVDKKIDTAKTSINPQDIVPGLYQNPIANISTAEGFVVTDSKAENNEDANKQVVDDHLEIALKNTSGKDLSGFEIYYTITDQTTNQKEGYYKKLDGFVLKSNETKSIHFDNKTGDGHFTSNTNSIYYKSPNKMVFDVIISVPNYKIETIKVNKDAGGAEQKD
ncbi:MAG: hypothetical protein QMB51_03275, partial [Patescibacteria group bacterium]